MKNPLVSIIVPVFNVEKYIERCARSIFEQTYHNLEIIFVDDCTPDNSIKILSKVMQDYPEREEQVKILMHKRNRGLSAARNTGIDAANGEYIYFVDSDDAIATEGIEILVQPLQYHLYDFVIGNFEIKGSLNNINIPRLYAEEGELIKEKVIEGYNFGLWYPMAWNKLINRNFLLNNNLFFKEGLIHEDELWSYKVAVTANSIFVVRDITYRYYFHIGSIMTSLSKKEEVESLKSVIAETREIQQKFSLFSYRYNYRIECLQDTLYKKMHGLKNNSRRVWYNIIRNLDHRTLKQKWMCYSEPLKVLPFNFHYFLPKNLGYWWHCWYGFWKRYR